MAETKVCNKCLKLLPVSNFYFRKEKGAYRGCCKKCKSVNTKEEIAKRLLATTKVCKHCRIEKPVSEYQKAGGGKWLQPYCKPCDAKRKQKYVENNIERVVQKRKRYYQENKNIIIERIKTYRDKNISKVKERSKRYYDKNRDAKRQKDKEYNRANRAAILKKSKERYYSNHEYYLAKQKEWRDKRTPEQIIAKREYDKKYKANNKLRLKKWRDANIDMVRASKRSSQQRNMSDPSFRLKKNLRSRIRIALKGMAKSDTTQNILGCSIDVFREYIESQFCDGMSWENYGKYGWHIDHKIPVSWFNLTNPNCLKLAFNYKNHQPLFWDKSLAKNNKYHDKLF